MVADIVPAFDWNGQGFLDNGLLPQLLILSYVMPGGVEWVRLLELGRPDGLLLGTALDLAASVVRRVGELGCS
jgi:hypothetical protein